MKYIAILAGFLFVSATAGASGVYQFDSAADEALFDEVTKELRCVVCQNQNLADSNADIAKDMKAEVYRMVQEDRDKSEILDFFVSRYGDFVRYNPPFNAITAVIWLGPLFLLLILAIGIFFRRRQLIKRQQAELSTEDRSRLESLLEEEQ